TQITPTGTTCNDFRTGVAADLSQGEYLVKGAQINNSTPGVMFYYTSIVAPSSSFTFTLNQSNLPLAGACSSWMPIPPQNLGQINLYDATCGARTSTNSYNSATGAVTMSITGATPGETLIIGVKYSNSSLKGQTVCRPHPTEKYTFSDSFGGTDSI